MRGAKTAFLICFTVTLLSLIFQNQAVFAEEELSISFSSNNLSLDLITDRFSSIDQTITVSTTNDSGYSVGIQTLGSSTDLVEQSDSSLKIPTFVLPFGSTSLPADSTGYGYGYSIDGGANYLPVPDPISSNTTIFETDHAGTNEHILTFGAKISDSASAGVYTNTFNIAVVVTSPFVCDPGYVCYLGNGDDGTGAMAPQAAESNSSAVLIAPNFSRPGYGFAGWNTKSNGTGTNYGPNETITTGDLSSIGLNLYANWVASAGLLQNWTSCSSMNTGDITALKDFRDNEVYAVAKLADGNCWMVENLRLVPSTAKISAANTNNPTATFESQAKVSSSSNNICNNDEDTCTDLVAYNTNNINRELTAGWNTNSNSSSWYSYGVNYNWYTATAGNGTYSMASGNVTGDICPAGWRLPTSTSAGEFAALNAAVNNSSTKTDVGLRTYPNNFAWSGDYNANISTGRGHQGRFWSATAANNNNAYRLGYSATASTPQNNYGKWDAFSIRCIVKSDNTVLTGNIHYEANGGTGNMADDLSVNLNTAAAKANTFVPAGDDIFAWWNTAADNSGTTVASEDMVAAAAKAENIVDGGTLTLYAIWGTTATLTYNLSGGVGGPEASTVIGIGSYTFSIASAIPTRDEYAFLGWSTNPHAETADYVFGDTITTSNRINTLYAVWKPVECAVGQICYRADGADAGTRFNQAAASNSNVILVAPDYSREGYGFLGWNTADDGTGTTYGPMETIRTGDLTSGGMLLYADWVASEGEMQGFSGCPAMNIGDITALTDNRDGNTYAIAKLADGNCWMVENLRLSPSAVGFTSANTNNPTSDFIAAAPSSSSSNRLCNTDTDACVNSIGYDTNNINRNLTPSYNTNNNSSSWYSYGVLYNWYTATAGNGTTSTASGNISGDICPAGWRIPTGGSGGEWQNLNNLVNNGLTNVNTGLRKYPNNLIYSGDHNATSFSGRGTYARYWSSTASDTYNAYRMGINATEVTPVRAWNKWVAFAVRCVAK